MEYPGTLLTRPIRRTILGLAITTFFVVAPTLVLYTAGYRYDWRNGLFRETGSISIDVEPETASAHLDGLKLNGTVPLRLKTITPRTYRLAITAPGYYDWEKDIEVKHRQTTYIRDVALIRQTSPRRLSAPGITVSTAAVAPGGTLVAYAQERFENKRIREVQVYLLNLENNVDTLVGSFPHPVSISWSPGNFFLIADTASPHKTMLVVNALNPHERINVAALARLPITQFLWKQNGEPELYFSTEDTITSLFAGNGQTRLVTTNTFDDWYLDEGKLWILTTDALTGETVITKDALGFSERYAVLTPGTLGLDSARWEFLVARSDRVFAYEKTTKTTFVITKSGITQRIPGSSVLMTKDGAHAAVWTPWEVWLYSVNADPALLNRSDEPLTTLAFLDDNATLVLAWEKKLVALFPAYAVEHLITSVQATSLSVDQANKVLYFTNDDGLWQLPY